VATFFIPGIVGSAQATEDAYGEMRRQTELEMGHRPTARRILSVWTRRGAIDCVTEVGHRDPVRDGTVTAIFDMGARQPFVVWWQQEPGTGEGVQEVLSSSTYAVLEFDA
jgi:hypothetical protein